MYSKYSKFYINAFRGYGRHVIGVPEGGTGTEKIYEDVMASNFPNLMRTLKLKIQET